MDGKKNPAAVALARRRQQLMTDAERQALHAARDRAEAQRTAAERSAIRRRGAMTRRLAGPAWARKSNSAPDAPPHAPAEMPTPAGELPPELAQLSYAIDDLPDDVLERLLVAIVGRVGPADD